MDAEHAAPVLIRLTFPVGAPLDIEERIVRKMKVLENIYDDTYDPSLDAAALAIPINHIPRETVTALLSCAERFSDVQRDDKMATRSWLRTPAEEAYLSEISIETGIMLAMVRALHRVIHNGLYF